MLENVSPNRYFDYQDDQINSNESDKESWIDINNSFAYNIYEVSSYHRKPIALPIYDKDSTSMEIPVSDTFLEDLYYRYDKIKIKIKNPDALESEKERYDMEKRDNFETPGIYNIIPDHIKKIYINTRYEKMGVSDLKFSIETYNRDRKKYINFLSTPLAKKRYIILSNYMGSHTSVPPQI